DAADVYEDVVAEVRDELATRVEALTAAGVKPERIILDPGLGFAKVGESNWPLLANIPAWAGDKRVLIGASRKRFLGAAIGRPDGDPTEREAATTAVTALVAAQGVWAVRVHDVSASCDAIAIANAWKRATHGPG